MGTNLTPFEGIFKRKGNKIFLKSGSLLITERPESKQTASKTALYLLKIDERGKREYVSSMYPIGVDTYSIEYAKIEYFVTLTNDQVTINSKQLGNVSKVPETNSHVYHTELVPKFETNNELYFVKRGEGGE